MPRTRPSRREGPLGAPGAPEPAADDEGDANPERETAMSESIGLALLAVLYFAHRHREEARYRHEAPPPPQGH